MKLSRYYHPSVYLSAHKEEAIRCNALPLRPGQWIKKWNPETETLDKGRFLRVGSHGELFISWEKEKNPIEHAKRMSRAIAHYRRATAINKELDNRKVLVQYRKTTSFLKRAKEMFF